jgi:predicted phage terminase large subunit-like protein
VVEQLIPDGVDVDAIAARIASTAEANELFRDIVRHEKDICRRYSEFFRLAWQVLEPETPLAWNWHIEYICDELQKQAERIANRESKEYDIIINVPPRSAKSKLVTICFQPWVWTQYPSQKFITASYSGPLALEHAVQSRRLILSEWYQEKWGDKFELTSDQNIKSAFDNSLGGMRIATSVGGTGTGRGGNWVICDDPQSADEAESEVSRKSVIDWWTRTMHSRLNDQKTDIRIIIQQRLHENDLTGYCLEHNRRTYKLICIPAEESDDIQPAEIRSKYTNGLFFPEKFSQPVLQDTRERIGDYGYAGQYQQRPSPAEGGIFKRHWWRFWKPAGTVLPEVLVKVGDQTISCPIVDLPESFDDMVSSWDTAFKDLKENDFVVGQVWASKGPNQYMLNQHREKNDYSKAVAAILGQYQRYPQCNGVLIEEAANGAAAISDIRRVIPGVIAVTPRGSKFARAMPLSRKAQAGNVCLPHPALAPWVSGLIERFAAFPAVTHDDEIDAASQATDHLAGLVRVWKDYGGQKNDFVIDWQNLGDRSSLLCSIWVEPSLNTSVIMAMWNSRDHRLAVFDEFSCNTPRADIVVVAISRLIRADSGGVFQNLSRFEVYGNSEMFANRTGIGDISDAYARLNVVLLKNKDYDELGAIGLVARLDTRKSLFIHTKAAELARQRVSWCIEGKKPAEGHGMCRALCNMAAGLWESGKVEYKEKPQKAYSKERTEYLQQAKENFRQGGAVAQIVSEMGGQGGGSVGWMI